MAARSPNVSDVHFLPATGLEEFGVEDPRITAIEGTVFFHLRRGLAPRRGDRAGLDGRLPHVRSARSRSSALKTRTWFCSPSESMASMSALHRPNAATPFCRPEMWVARSPDLIHWGRHDCLHGGGAEWETGRVGAGTPPVSVADGWLEIYHGNRQPTRPGEVGTYATGVLLLDPKNPAAILRRTPRFDFRADGRLRATRLRARRRLSHGNRRIGTVRT